MKLKRFIFLLLIPFIFSSCSVNEETGNSNNCSYDPGSPAIFYIGNIPGEFYFNNNRYVENSDLEFYYDNEYKLFGYLINEEDLEHWQEYDNNSSLIYVVLEDNTLEHNDYDYDYWKNRYELYWIEEPYMIGLYGPSISSVYVMEG